MNKYALAGTLLLAGALSAGDDAALDKTIRALDGVSLRDDKADGKPIVEISFSHSKKLKDADMKLVGAEALRKALPKCECVR